MSALSVTHDHASMTVPDLEQAVDFLTRVLGGRVLYRRVIAAGADPHAMSTNYHAHPDAALRLAKLDLGGLQLEVFEYDAPDTAAVTARNCDPGGHHLGFAVQDIDHAVGVLNAEPGVRVLGSVSVLPDDHPLAGRRWVYFLTPWQQQMELVDDTLLVGHDRPR